MVLLHYLLEIALLRNPVQFYLKVFDDFYLTIQEGHELTFDGKGELVAFFSFVNNLRAAQDNCCRLLYVLEIPVDFFGLVALESSDSVPQDLHVFLELSRDIVDRFLVVLLQVVCDVIDLHQRLNGLFLAAQLDQVNILVGIGFFIQCHPYIF